MDVCIYGGFRTPFGRLGGVLAGLRPDDMLAAVIRGLVARIGVDPASIEDVIVGNTNQAGEDSRNIGRNSALLAGLPIAVGGITVNRLCGSGVAATLDAARALRCQEGSFMIAAGVESMSRAPWVLGKADAPFARNQALYDTTIGARFPNLRFVATFGGDTMPQTADNIARDLSVSRVESDRFAAQSQQKFEAARVAEFFRDEMLQIEMPPLRRGDKPYVIAQDEHPRPETTPQVLATLKPLQEGGVVTAGNASGLNDGAGALLLGTARAGEQAGLAPRAKVIAGAIAGVAPRLMGLGPVPAIGKVLDRAGLRLADMDVIEINEAFAVQVLGCLKQLELAFDDPRVNPNGGAIAVGHPLGASGIRLILTALRQLERIDGRYALVAMCIGMGQGIAVLIERAA